MDLDLTDNKNYALRLAGMQPSASGAMSMAKCPG